MLRPSIATGKNHHAFFIAYIHPVLVIRNTNNIYIQTLHKTDIITSELLTSFQGFRYPSFRRINGITSQIDRFPVQIEHPIPHLKFSETNPLAYNFSIRLYFKVIKNRSNRTPQFRIQTIYFPYYCRIDFILKRKLF